MPRLLIVDEHPLVRDGLRTVLTLSLDDCVVAQAAAVDDALDLLAVDPGFAVAFLGLQPPGPARFTALAALRDRHPALPVVMISDEGDPRVAMQALQRGAAGVMPPSLARADVIEGVRTVLAGGVFTPRAQEHPSRDLDDLGPAERVARLTPQQRTVLALVVAGRPNKEIAFDLAISERTVKAHVSAILQKLRVFSRTQAVILANRIGFEGEQRPVGAREAIRAAC